MHAAADGISACRSEADRISRMADSSSSTPKLAELTERLREDRSAQKRTEAAVRIADEFASGVLQGKERELALQIITNLARDVEQQVRATLAEHVKSCPSLPPELARMLAEDVETVSLPIIRFSPSLSEEDLIAIVHLGDTAKQVAIAQRDQVSVRVSEVLVETGKQTVVVSLLENSGAEISEGSLHKVIDQFGTDERVGRLIVNRATLPLGVTDRLIRTVSKALRTHLIEHHGLPWEFAHELARQAGEGALVQRMIANPSVNEVERLANDLHAKRKLTATLLLRAICMGDSHFFEVGVAVLAGIRVENAPRLIYDPQGFKALYGKAGLPHELFRAFRTAVTVMEDVKLKQHESWRREHSEQLVERLAQEHRAVCPDGLRNLLSQLSARIRGRPLTSLLPV
jgi:uncharacterized protein (DUF2336 family)